MCVFKGIYIMFFMLICFGVAACIIIPVSYFIFHRRLNKVAELLDDGRFNDSSFNYWEAWGKYKGRIISAEYNFIQTRLLPNGFYIWPSDVSEEKLFILNYPCPTKHTYLMKGRIKYNSMFVNELFLNEKKITAMFDELTEAAEIVEKNLPYYDTTGSLGRRIAKLISRNLVTILVANMLFALIVCLYFQAIGRDPGPTVALRIIILSSISALIVIILELFY